MRKAQKTQGFTLAEVLIVLGIMAAIAAVAFISIPRYLRSLTKLEYDNYAKEIFIAAQNHLSMAESEGYLGRSKFGTKDSDGGAYYFVVNTPGGTSLSDDDAVLGLMLPFGAVDETVRMGGSYIVRYHKETGQVLDVFYWEESNARFTHTYSATDYQEFLSSRNNSDALKTYVEDGSVIGYYGGVTAQAAPTERLMTPSIEVFNSDRLTAKVTFPNNSDSSIGLKLIITGVQSGMSREVPITRITGGAGDEVYDIVLDDVTTAAQHFYDQFCTGADPLIPGEDILVQAVAEYSDGTKLYSTEKRSNSLFGDDTSITGSDSFTGKAEISNIRHLENLSNPISYVNASLAKVHIEAADQTGNLDWNGFMGGSASVVPVTGTATGSGYYLPVTPGYQLAYDGKEHSVSNIKVKDSENAGLFGDLDQGGSVRNLKLVNFDISGTNAGALAGSTTGTEIVNVLATGPSAVSVTGTGAAGGLIGSMTGGKMIQSAAALVVESTGGAAGGLVGTAAESAEIALSYSGGHTTGGRYLSDNVTGATAAGGLVGSFFGALITDSYSTCSVKATGHGAKAGGFAGEAESGSLSNCYSTGRVTVRAGASRGAFAGSLDGASASGEKPCLYYEIINEIPVDGDPAKGYAYLSALGSGTDANIKAFDAGVASFERFVNDVGDSGCPGANVYDYTLSRHYRGKYPLRSAAQLGGSELTGFVQTHYGDWPAPELWIINK